MAAAEAVAAVAALVPLVAGVAIAVPTVADEAAAVEAVVNAVALVGLVATAVAGVTTVDAADVSGVCRPWRKVARPTVVLALRASASWRLPWAG